VPQQSGVAVGGAAKGLHSGPWFDSRLLPNFFFSESRRGTASSKKIRHVDIAYCPTTLGWHLFSSSLLVTQHVQSRDSTSVRTIYSNAIDSDFKQFELQGLKFEFLKNFQNSKTNSSLLLGKIFRMRVRYSYPLNFWC